MRRTRSRRPVLRALALAAAGVTVAAVWFVATVAYPRMSDPDPIPALTEPIAFPSGLDREAIDARLAELAGTFLARGDSAGIALGVVVNGERHAMVRGVPSKHDGLRPLDADSLFEIASVTKVFTGVALAQALLRKELTLEQPIAPLLPGAYASAELTARGITVGDLATHHAGLQRSPSAIPAWSPMLPGNPWSELSEADMVASLNKALGDPPVSTSYSYSGFGYMLLGRILEAASGRSYADLVEQGIGAPLGMTNTWVALPDEARARLVDGHRNGHTLEHHLDHTFPAAGGIASSLDDLLTFVEANLDPRATPIGEALELATAGRRPANGETTMALGWHVDPGPERARLIYHHGAMIGFWSYIGFSPEAGVGVVALANSRDPSVSALAVQLLEGLARARVTSGAPR